MFLPRFLLPALVLPTLLASTTALRAATPTPEAKLRQQVQQNYGKLPVHFEANAGQTDARVRFFAHGNGYGLFVTPTEATLPCRRNQGAHRLAAVQLRPEERCSNSNSWVATRKL